MKKNFFIALSIILLIKNTISEKSLTFEVKFEKREPGKMTTTFLDKTEFYISFSHSKIISKELSNLQDINVTNDECIHYKKLKMVQ